MSLNRENVTWQSADGKWNMGFYDYEYVNTESEDFDSEWDVEYNYDMFCCVIKNKLSPEDAYNSYVFNHANPGGTVIYDYTEENMNMIESFEAIFNKMLTKTL